MHGRRYYEFACSLHCVILMEIGSSYFQIHASKKRKRAVAAIAGREFKEINVS